MKRFTLLLAAFLLWGSTARADATISAGQMSVNGQEVRDVKCTLKNAGFLGVMTVVMALATEKKALDACAPTGAAFKAEWAWKGGKAADVKVLGSSLPAKDACVAAAIGKTKASTDGSCTGVILVGKAEAARKAAEGLKPEGSKGK